MEELTEIDLEDGKKELICEDCKEELEEESIKLWNETIKSEENK